MALDKNDLLSLIATNLPDNTTGLITPAAVREVEEQAVTANANLEELTVQTFKGPITFEGKVLGAGPANRIVINEYADFPIPLTADTEYFVGGPITFPTTLPATFNDLPNGVRFTGGAVSSQLIYNGTGTFLKGVDVGSLFIEGVTIIAPAAKVFDITDVSATTIVNIDSSAVVACDQFGSFDCFALVFSVTNVISTNQGIELTGTKTQVLSIEKMTINSADASFVAVDLGSAVMPSVEISNLRSNGPAGSVGIKGLAGSANISANQKATITSCEFTGGITALDTIDENDFRYKFVSVTDVRDTNPDAIITLTNNATATTISASSSDGSNAVLVAGAWATKGESQYATTAAGRITALFESPVPSPITVSASIEPVSGTNVTIAVYVCVNGVIQVESGIVVRVDSNNPLAVTVVWQEEMSSTVNSYIEVFVENRTNTTNILVSGAVLRVR
jgi:hypothetical protein